MHHFADSEAGVKHKQSDCVVSDALGFCGDCVVVSVDVVQEEVCVLGCQGFYGFHSKTPCFVNLLIRASMRLHFDVEGPVLMSRAVSLAITGASFGTSFALQM